MATLKQDLGPKRAYRMLNQGRLGHGRGAGDTDKGAAYSIKRPPRGWKVTLMFELSQAGDGPREKHKELKTRV